MARSVLDLGGRPCTSLNPEGVLAVLPVAHSAERCALGGEAPGPLGLVAVSLQGQLTVTGPNLVVGIQEVACHGRHQDGFTLPWLEDGGFEAAAARMGFGFRALQAFVTPFIPTPLLGAPGPEVLRPHCRVRGDDRSQKQYGDYYCG